VVLNLLTYSLRAKYAPVAGFKTPLVTLDPAHCVPQVDLSRMPKMIIRTMILSKIVSLVHEANTAQPVHCFVTNALLVKNHLKIKRQTKPVVYCVAVDAIKLEQVKTIVTIAALEPINLKMAPRFVFRAMLVCINPLLVNRCVLIVMKDITKNRLDHKIVHRVWLGNTKSIVVKPFVFHVFRENSKN